MLPLACALPALAAAVSGAGRWAPGSVEALTVASLIGLLILAQRRLRTAPPEPHELLLAIVGGVALGVAALAGGLSGFGSSDPPPLAHLLRGRALLAAVASAACFGLLALAPLLEPLRHWLCDVPPLGGEPLAPSWTWGSGVVLLVGVLVHGVVFFAHEGPLIQVDSWTHLYEPPLFEFGERPHHYTPIYAYLIKFANGFRDPVLGLTALVALQHVATVCMGVAAERTTRLASGSALAGVCAGLLIACCGHLSLYAQEVMSEVLATAWLVLATACVFAAPRSPRPQRWLIAGGLATAAATLTRQAMQGWFVVGALAVALLGWRHRKRAVVLYLAAALLPLAALVVHNGVFRARFSLTAGLGRNLHYRIAKGLPDLTDPDAEPGDPYERARELIWEHREAGWIQSYSAIQTELGWSDPQIERAMQRFYVEQVLRHPVPFTRLTLGYCWTLLDASESGDEAIRFHNRVLDDLTIWRGLPRGHPETWVGGGLHAFQPTSWWPVLLLAACAPLLARGRGRVLALLAVGSVAYFVVVTSLVELPVPRYRLPTIPFLAIACALGLGALLRLVAARSRGSTG